MRSQYRQEVACILLTRLQLSPSESIRVPTFLMKDKILAKLNAWKRQKSICIPAVTFSPSYKRLWISKGTDSLAPKSVRSIYSSSLEDLAIDAITLSSTDSADQLSVSRRIIPGSHTRV